MLIYSLNHNHSDSKNKAKKITCNILLSLPRELNSGIHLLKTVRVLNWFDLCAFRTLVAASVSNPSNKATLVLFHHFPGLMIFTKSKPIETAKTVVVTMQWFEIILEVEQCLLIVQYPK